MKYNNFRKKALGITEANQLLYLLKTVGVNIHYIGISNSYREEKAKLKQMYKNKFNYTSHAIIKENLTNIWIETKYYEPKYKPTRYVVDLNEERKPVISGLQAFNEWQRWGYAAINVKNYPVDILSRWLDSNTNKYVCSASPTIGFKEAWNQKELHNVYEYDLHSAYSSVMLDKVPNVNNPIFNAKIKEGQIGFFIDEQLTLIETVGIQCDVVFDLITLHKGAKDYILRLYAKKEEATDELEHDEVKLKLNAAIGYYQRYNPFMRAYIVHKCNNKINFLIDENTVLWNTDAIFSLVRRPDLDIGENIGQFKETFIENFVYINNNYQVNDELPLFRGFPKIWMKNYVKLHPDKKLTIWDILHSEDLSRYTAKFRLNVYCLVKDDRYRIIKNKEWSELWQEN